MPNIYARTRLPEPVTRGGGRTSLPIWANGAEIYESLPQQTRDALAAGVLVLVNLETNTMHWANGRRRSVDSRYYEPCLERRTCSCCGEEKDCFIKSNASAPIRIQDTFSPHYWAEHHSYTDDAIAASYSAICPDCFVDRHLICTICGVPLNLGRCAEHGHPAGYSCAQCGRAMMSREPRYSLVNRDEAEHSVCSACRDRMLNEEHYDSCVSCGALFPADGSDYCHPCRERIVTCPECSRDFDTYEYSRCPHCGSGGPNTIHDYSFRPSYKLLKAQNETDERALFLGPELEVEFKNSRSYQSVMPFINTKTDSVLYGKHDGSISNGVEICSHPATLSVHSAKIPWAEMFELLEKHTEGRSNCGMHVHVNKSFFTKAGLTKLAIFVLANQVRIEALARRTASRWAVFKKAARPFSAIARSSVRYEALNFTNAKTVEFRIFASTTDYDVFMSCLELVDAICRFTQWEGTPNMMIDNVLGWNEFLKFVRNGKYAYLEKYIHDRINNPEDSKWSKYTVSMKILRYLAGEVRPEFVSQGADRFPYVLLRKPEDIEAGGGSLDEHPVFSASLKEAAKSAEVLYVQDYRTGNSTAALRRLNEEGSLYARPEWTKSLRSTPETLDLLLKFEDAKAAAVPGTHVQTTKADILKRLRKWAGIRGVIGELFHKTSYSHFMYNSRYFARQFSKLKQTEPIVITPSTQLGIVSIAGKNTVVRVWSVFKPTSDNGRVKWCAIAFPVDAVTL